MARSKKNFNYIKAGIVPQNIIYIDTLVADLGINLTC